MRRTLFPLASLLVSLLAACTNDASVAFTTGSGFDLSADAIGLPPGLRTDTASGPVLMSVPCGAMGSCALGTATDAVTFECVAGVCDPAPKTVTLPVGEPLDLDVAAGDLSDVLDQAEHVVIRRVAYDVPTNTLSVELPAVEIFWGPETATAVDPSMGVVALGTLPAVPARTAAGGDMAIDTAGRDALSDYIVGTSHRLRFFARTRIDLAPGGPYPEGAARIDVLMDVEASGRIVR